MVLKPLTGKILMIFFDAGSKLVDKYLLWFLSI